MLIHALSKWLLYCAILMIATFGMPTIAFANKAEALAGTANGQPIFLKGFQAAGTAKSVRLVLDLTSEVEVRTSFVDGPYRLILDLPKVEVGLSSEKAGGKPGFIDKIQFGTLPDQTLRFVIEMAKPFVLERRFFVPAADSDLTRLVFDFSEVDAQNFKVALNTGSPEDERKDSAGPTSLAQEKSQQNSAAPKEDRGHFERKRRIVIDPGHGGKDGGARTQNGVLEKDIVLSFSKKLARALAKSGQFDIILTRTDDQFLRLSERVQIARDAKADLFVSIHADSLPDDRRVRGTAVYTVSERASDAMAARIANEQNKSDAIAGVEVRHAPDGIVDILFDLTRRETSNLSIVFARHFHNEMKSKIRFFKKPLQRGAFTVLRVPDIPSALIELGFLSNKQDAILLSSNAWREQAATHMATTIIQYFEKPVIGLR